MPPRKTVCRPEARTEVESEPWRDLKIAGWEYPAIETQVGVQVRIVGRLVGKVRYVKPGSEGEGDAIRWTPVVLEIGTQLLDPEIGHPPLRPERSAEEPHILDRHPLLQRVEAAKGPLAVAEENQGVL
jgi:hypothetical protein